ncbi:type I pantothenate kinase [Pseudomonas syringae]|nr:type I pantothenate kinase [Pseudomonas syringae]
MSQGLVFKSTGARFEFSHEEWSHLHPHHTDKAGIFQSLSNLLKLHYAATLSMQKVQSIFLNQPFTSRPYIVGVTGSVSVGKSEFSKFLLASLKKWGMYSSVQLITTDSFLFPLEILRKRGLIDRKGFPESYDRAMIFDFLNSTKCGCDYKVPIYSHEVYDVIAGQYQNIHSPDIIILEGVNVCQIDKMSPENILDFVDFSIYLDAPEELIKSWYVERFIRLKTEAAQGKKSYFSQFKNLSTFQVEAIARKRWDLINSINLRENIFPSRDNADLIIEKSAGHMIDRLRLRAF